MMPRRRLARRLRLLAPLAPVALLTLGTAHAQLRSPPPGAAPAASATPATTSLAAPGYDAGIDALRTSDYPRAERELASVSGANGPAAHLALARAMLEQGKFGDAEKHARLAGAAASLRADAAVVQAEVLVAQGKGTDAVSLLEPIALLPPSNGVERARILLGETLIALGRRADAGDPLHKIIDDYNADKIADTDAEGLAIAGRAAFLLRKPKDANTLFNKSEQVDKKREKTLLWRAELFLDKYDPGHAEEVTKEALAIAPHRADGLVLMARVKLDQSLDFDAAEKLVKDALAVNPKHTGAFAVRAGLALRDGDLAAAEQAIAAGFATNPNDLELWSLRAAARFLADDLPGYEAAKKETLARDPQYSHFFEIVGEYAEWEHRYDDIVTMMKEATTVDPDDEKAWAQLGLTELRGGDEKSGLEALDKAWAKDAFNVRVYNTLNLYEKTIAARYEMGTGATFNIRYEKDEKPVLERYVPKLLGEAWGSMKARYGFAPTTPVQVELYADRQQFSVRTSGLPNIGIQGVCFGRVIAAMSPKSEPFNWGNVVWHELGHVFAIQLSKNHVPRWFTEGLSEYETIARRPEWQRELDPELYKAISKGSLPGAVDMNRAFTHASNAQDVTVAYYAASQMLVFTAERFGMGKIVEALKLWGAGVRTPDVIQRAFGVSAREYDQKFRAWAMARMSRYNGQLMFDLHGSGKTPDEAKAAVAAAPRDANAHVEYALALLHSRKAKEARAELDAALQIDPKNTNAHFVAAKLAESDKDVAGAAAHLDAIRAAGGDGYAVRMALADLAEAKKDKAGMRASFEAAYRFDPTQSEPLKGLYDLANDEKRDADALDVLRRLSVLEQHDRQIWRLYLERLVAAQRWDEARKVGESALLVDVETASTHVLYARALAATGAHDRALFELESALLCSPPPKEAATAHALMATELVATKNVAEARRHLDEARRLDPENAEAKTVKLP